MHTNDTLAVYVQSRAVAFPWLPSFPPTFVVSLATVPPFVHPLSRLLAPLPSCQVPLGLVATVTLSEIKGHVARRNQRGFLTHLSRYLFLLLFSLSSPSLRLTTQLQEGS